MRLHDSLPPQRQPTPHPLATTAPVGGARRAERSGMAAAVRSRELVLDVDDLDLPATLTIPDRAHGLAVFAHGSRGNRFAPRDRQIAQALQRAGIGTLLFDLLSDAESRDLRVPFDLDRLSRRFLAVARWASGEALLGSAPLGYFGVSTGAAAAVIAAAERPDLVAAVACEDARLDLAEPSLPQLTAPTLLLVDGTDSTLRELNARAAARSAGLCQLTVLPGDGRRFAGPPPITDVARAITTWFLRHLRPGLIDAPPAFLDPGA
jgi:dienelactone hydrolase